MGPLVTLEMCQLVICGCPAGDGPAQLVDLGWAGFVLEVVGELQGVAERDGDAVDVVDAPYCLFGVPGGADFSVGVTGVEETTQPCAASVADTFGSSLEETPRSIQWVAFAASVSEGFVLDPCADFVEALVG